MRHPSYGILFVPTCFALTALAACYSGGNAQIESDGGFTVPDVSTPVVHCDAEAGCDAAPPPPPGACDGSAGSCVPAGSVGAGKPCTFTADCKGNYYCGADGACDPSGTAGVGAVCTTTGSCIRGAVCFRATPGLYGVCEVPAGTTIAVPGDGGGPDGSPSDGGTVMGAAGTAHAIGGKCKTLLDCQAGLACAANGTCEPGVPGEGLPTPWLGATCNDALPADAGTAVRAYFELPAADGTPPYDFFRLPFPNDVRRDPTTHKINLTGFPHPGTALLGFDIVQLYAQQSEDDLDGFGTNQYVYFRFSNAINLDTLSVVAPETVNMYDLSAPATTDGGTPGAPVQSLGFSASTAGNHYICANNIKVSTGPMVPGHTYAVTLNNVNGPMKATITDTNGNAVQPDAQFTPMLSSTAPGGSDPTLLAAWNAYAPLRTYIAANGIDASTIIDAAVFTTESATAEMPLLRKSVLAATAPAASSFVKCAAGVTSPCDDGLTGAAHTRGCIGPFSTEYDELQGKITLPIMQQGTRPYSSLDAGGAIQLGDGGTPIVQGQEPVCVSITVPHGVAPPAGGWPVVLYSHGTGGFYRSGVLEGLAGAVTSIALPAPTVPDGGVKDAGHKDAAATPTTAAFAFVGYDGVMTGPRAGDAGGASPDTLFFNFANPVAARDNVLQGSADIFALVKALETVTPADIVLPVGDAGAPATAFNPKKIYFIGHSQGSTVGVPASPYEPGLAGMVFSGAGGDLRESLVTKTNPVDIADLTGYVLEDAPVDSSHPALNMFQAFIERSDAVNYGAYLLGNLQPGVVARPIVQTYGIGDTYAPDPTMQAVAAAIGLNAAGVVPGPNPWPSATGLALPLSDNYGTSSGNVTAAILEATPTGPYDGHFVLFDDPALQQQVMQFLGTASATGTAIIEPAP